jgi:nucleoid DNA-binding protein
MRKTHWLALAALIGTLAATAYSQLPAPLPPGSLPADVAKATKVNDENVRKVFDALGPTITRQLAAGRQVDVPGLGRFRVVRLSATRNLEDGKVVNQPARNVVEFLADPVVEQAANAPGAVPALTVPAFQYVPLPGQTPTQKVPNERVPSTRIR